MNAKDAAIAFALTSYGKSAVEESSAPINKVVEHKGQKLVQVPRKANKVAPVESTEIQATPKTAAPIGLTSFPQKGTLNTAGFMTTMRNAGRREVNGKMVTDAALVRDDKIKAIAAFIGYDPKGDFASQEMAALSRAKLNRNPIDTSGPSLLEQRQAKRSALGYVKGMPNPIQVKLEDLLKREELAVDTMIAEQTACDKATAAGDQTTATHHAGLALLEQERLDHIRAEIKSLVG